MFVPLTVNDFLRRAELLYPNRAGIVDEPDQPAPSWGTLTYAEVAERARAIAAGLDELGIGVGERVAIVSHNSARLITALFGVSGSGRVLVPINFRLVAEEIRYIVGHCGARVLLVDPELDDALSSVTCEHRWVIGAESDDILFRFGVEPRPWEPDEAATATINYTSGTTARPKGVQLTHRNIWVNATTFGWHMGVNDRDVYLHTLPQFHCNGWGMLYAVAGMGGSQVVLRKVDGAEILRRVDQYGVTLMCGAPAVVNMVLDAAATWDGPIPGSGRTRIVVAGAPPPTRTIERVESRARLGVRADLRAHRDVAAADDEPRPRRVRRPVAGRSGDEARPRRRPGDRGPDERQRPGRGARAEQRRDGRLLGPGRRHRRRHRRRLVPHRRRRHDRRRQLRDHLRSEEGRDHLGGRERVVDRGRGRDLPAPRRHRGGRDRDPRREVGRARDRARRHAPGSSLSEADVIAWTKQKLAGYKCPKRVEFRSELARTATGKLQKFKLREPFWEGHTRQVN